LKIATVSLNQIWENKKANLKECKNSIKSASKKGADLIIFPEMTLTGFSNNIKLIAEDYENSKTIQAFQKLSQLYDISIIFGVVLKSNQSNKALNSLIFLSNKGKILNRYTKIHPFSFANEDKFFESGNSIETVNYQNYNIGLSICYDLRFPEIFSTMSKSTDIIINIANWPKKRVKHWKALLKARAIETQNYFIGVNRTGVDGNKIKYQESSMVFNFNGDKISYQQFKNMKIFKLNKENTYDFKSKFNTIQDKKFELYESLNE